MSPVAPMKPAPPRLPAEGDLMPLDLATIEDGESYRSRILSDSAFAGASTNLTLEGSRLIQVRLDGSQWDRSFWSDLALHGCDLSNLRWRRIDLRGCNLEGVRAGPAELKGATIDPVQAVALAEALGLKVEWAADAEPNEHVVG